MRQQKYAHHCTLQITIRRTKVIAISNMRVSRPVVVRLSN